MRRLARAAALLFVAAVVLAAVAGGGAGPALAVEPDPIGLNATLAPEPGAHWVWLADVVLHRTALFDGDSGGFLGMLSGGAGVVYSPSVSAARHEIYLPETYYARGTRGARTDVVTFYDGVTLRPVSEVEIPPKRADFTNAIGSSALSDDGRFLAVFNLTPANSISVVDVEARRFVSEIATPGCSLVYPAGPRRFLMLCGDGGALLVSLDEAGRAAGRSRSAPFFDPNADPVTEKGVRLGSEWLFPSYEGYLYPIDVSGPEPRFGERWSLFSDADRAASWRVGGMQPLAVNAASGRLYVLVHEGGPDTHKDPGREVWVYDVARRQRVQVIELRSPLAAIVRRMLGAPAGGTASWLIDLLLPNPGVDRIAVTPDAEALLFASATFPASLGVYDARSGAFLRDVSEPGIAGSVLVLP
jgi:methylamine dehydrogenase heavy chain